MALTANLITVAEADAALNVEIFPLWMPQSIVMKDHHIRQASTYVRVNWTCTDEDFATPNLSDDAKYAVALYAEASRAGNLYDSASDTPAVGGGGAITRKTLKVGSLEDTTEYDSGVAAVGGADNPLGMADDIFNALGCTNTRTSTAVSLVRV